MDRAAWSVPSLLLMIFALQMVAVTVAAPAGDLVPNLPGQPTVDFKQYAGYITVNQSHGRKLFYYFVEAQNSSATKPLLLWLNGGPGCSSLIGAFTELGPFNINGSGDGLYFKQDSWNQVANIIFLESPAGVGFSYSNDTSDYNTGDMKTAEDSLAFILGWLAEYPEYKSTDFYIAGESYAGHYVPQLATAILNNNNISGQVTINLKGIMAGDPFFDQILDGDSSVLLYGYAHGMMSESLYDIIVGECNFTNPANYTDACRSALNAGYNQLGANNSLANPYDVLVDVCVESSAEVPRLQQRVARMESTPDPCIMDKLTKYLNLPEVQRSLHAEVTDWVNCSNVLNYSDTDYLISMLPVLAGLVISDLRVWIYSGDQDLILPLIGTRKMAAKVAEKVGLTTTSDYQLWLQDGQIGGWSRSWGNGSLVFATVRGAGHQVPMYQLARSLVLLTSFLAGDNSPPVQTQPR